MTSSHCLVYDLSTDTEVHTLLGFKTHKKNNDDFVFLVVKVQEVRCDPSNETLVAPKFRLYMLHPSTRRANWVALEDRREVELIIGKQSVYDDRLTFDKRVVVGSDTYWIERKNRMFLVKCTGVVGDDRVYVMAGWSES